jgi:hypothetical protein
MNGSTTLRHRVHVLEWEGVRRTTEAATAEPAKGTQWIVMCWSSRFLAASILSLLATGSLFTLKLADLVRVKRSGVNGPMLYMKKDNIRHQGVPACDLVGDADGGGVRCE